MLKKHSLGSIRHLVATVSATLIPIMLLGGGPGPPPPPGSAPLDPLSWMLLIGAASIAAKKIYSAKVLKDSNPE